MTPLIGQLGQQMPLSYGGSFAPTAGSNFLQQQNDSPSQPQSGLIGQGIDNYVNNRTNSMVNSDLSKLLGTGSSASGGGGGGGGLASLLGLVFGL